jgi:hypothetical protein
MTPGPVQAGRVLRASPGFEPRRQALGQRQAPAQTARVEPPSPSFRIVVRDEAVVAERGEAVVVWFVRFGAAWVRAVEHPRAVVSEARADRQDVDCPPGTIWRRVVQLELERGTILRKTLSRPLTRRQSPMEHLMSGSLEKRREVKETHYRVVGADRLERQAGP